MHSDSCPYLLKVRNYIPALYPIIRPLYCFQMIRLDEILSDKLTITHTSLLMHIPTIYAFKHTSVLVKSVEIIYPPVPHYQACRLISKDLVAHLITK